MKLSKPSDITNITFLNWLVGSYKKVSDHKNHAWSFCLAPNCSVSSIVGGMFYANCWFLYPILTHRWESRWFLSSIGRIR